MRRAVIGVAIVALLSGCGGTSHPATTAAPPPTHAQIVAAAKAKADAQLVAKNAVKARALGYTVRAGEEAGVKIQKLSHRGCGEFGNHGCWRVDIVTLKKCAFFEMDIIEMRGEAQVETYIDNQANVEPLTPLHGQFDATEDNVYLGRPAFTCTN